MVGLHVRLEDGDDRRAGLLGCGEVATDQLGVVDDGESRPRRAAEQVVAQAVAS